MENTVSPNPTAANEPPANAIQTSFLCWNCERAPQEDEGRTRPRGDEKCSEASHVVFGAHNQNK